MLAASMVRAPRDIPGWMHTLPFLGRTPIGMQLPWWSYGAIRYMDRYLTSTHRVFEYGSGGSSLFLARRAAAVVAVENDPAWHRLVVDTAAAHGLAHLSCELHPLSDDSLASFRRSEFSRRIAADVWDVVVIDCHCGFNEAPFGVIRPAAFADALERVRPGGLIVLDDSWMFPDLLLPRDGWTITTFQGLGPCRYGTTSTAILQRAGGHAGWE